MTLLLLALAIAGEVAGTLALRAMPDSTHPRRWATVVALGYVESFVLLGKVLSTGWSVGVVYAIWAAVGVAVTAVLGSWLFDDRLSPAAVLGIVLIICGVAAIEYGASP